MIPFVFQFPMMLLLLLLVIPLTGVLRHARKRRKIVLEEMGSGDLPTFAPWRDRIRLVAMGLLILGLARPGFDPQRQSVSQSGRDVVFVLDVSRSMLAEDASPNRLEAAKNGIRDALDSFSAERVGLVIYAGSSNILCPLTYDYNFVRYMLDQATTRAVDFGGTVLLSAVEKCVDNVLIDGREGMHDLVVLTDGEEHGAENDRVAELLKEHHVGMLLIGIGDSSAGSRIPIPDDEGKRTYVKFKGDFVTTRLQDSELRKLVQGIDGAVYQPVGASSFDLAGIYHDFAAGKPVSGATGDDTFVTYGEAGFLLMALALILLVIAERKMIPPGRSISATALSILLCAARLSAAETWVEVGYAKAVKQQEAGRFDEALETFGLIETEGGSNVMSNGEIASMRFNEGLCFLAQSTAEAEREPRSALSLAMQAQSRFLTARRLDPTFDRAGQRLDPTAKMILSYREKIEEDDKKQQELQARVQKLVEMLQALHASQTELRNEVPGRPDRSRQPTPPAPRPETATADSANFSKKQLGLVDEAGKIITYMIELDQELSATENDLPQPPVTVLHEPRLLMGEAIAAQERATVQLRQWSSWPDARVQQQIALDKIQAIIDLLSSDNSGESEEGESDEEDWDNMEYTESEDGMPSSLDGEGDFSSSTEMQALPTPNYSVQDILMQEQGSLQFRQQQRAANNTGKIEKDW